MIRNEFSEFSNALRELFLVIAKELGIPKLLDWLTEKLEDWRNGK